MRERGKCTSADAGRAVFDEMTRSAARKLTGESEKVIKGHVGEATLPRRRRN
jgi:hypothetical protein